MAGSTAIELTCPKWNKTVAEATCNICKDQCDNSIANPDNFIAKRLIVDLEKVKENRLKLNLFNEPKVELSKTEPKPVPEPVSNPEQEFDDDELEAELNNIDFIKEEIEETFKDRADMIIDSLGLAHMKTKNKNKKAP